MSSEFVVIWFHLLRIVVCKSANSIKRSEVPNSAVAAAGIYLQCVIYSHMKSLIFYIRTHTDVRATPVTNCTGAGLFSISVALRPRVLCRIPCLILLMAPINSVLAAVRQ